MTSAPAIGFEYRPSRLLQRASIAVAALAVLAVALCALTLWLKLLLVAGVLLTTWQSIRRVAASPVAAVGCGSDNDWTLRLIDHEDVSATLASFRVLGGFVLLRLRVPQRGVQVVLLAPDNSDADIRRRMRMRLATLQLDNATPRI
jgi:toxin CptA